MRSREERWDAAVHRQVVGARENAWDASLSLGWASSSWPLTAVLHASLVSQFLAGGSSTTASERTGGEGRRHAGDRTVIIISR